MSTSAADASPARSVPRLRLLARLLLRGAVVLVVLVMLGRAFVSVYTNVLWFRSVQHGDVYTRRLWTQVLLFAVFGVVMAAVVAANLTAVLRWRTATEPAADGPRWRRAYARWLHPRRRWVVGAVAVLLGVQLGSRAAGSWQTWLLWRDAVPFHVTDPQFHRDVSYYLFVFPLHRLVLTLLFRVVAISLVAVLVGGYLYGDLRPRGPARGVSRALRGHVSLLLGVYLLLKAVGYWLDRYATATSSRAVVTGPTYTDVHALLPGKAVLIVIALLCAVALVANTALRSTRLLVTAIGVMAGSALVLGIVVPAIVQQFREKPSASALEAPYIARNITATRDAFGLASSLSTSTLPTGTSSTPTALRAQVTHTAQVRLLDPNRLSPTFNQLQQEQRAFYGFKSTLDVDRYPVAGGVQDVVLAARELQLSGLPASQRTWTNTHLVYTHGYGVVAAPTNRVDAQGEPTFTQPGGYEPRIYYGQSSPSYSVVGGPPGSAPREFDRPGAGGQGQVENTHTGGGGVPIGSTFRRLVYALKLHSTAILFSSEINRDSQLLTIRNPRARVAAVAPWLTLDGDVYPVVTGGRVLWVVDGYTTASTYPYSQVQNLRAATTTTLDQQGSTVTQPSTPINYIRNSVKATVDAYSGAVTLYQWTPDGRPDPVLATWEKAFPGLVQPQSAIPTGLLGHLRYPQDLFDLQRTVLTRYHVTDPHEYYSGSDFWKVPADPTVVPGTTKTALGKTVAKAAPAQPSTYMTLSPDGTAAPAFSLSAPLVTLSQRSLAAFMSVDATPGPDYGRISLVQLPPATAARGLVQIENDIESDPTVVSELTLLRGGNSRVVLGNLLTIPFAGQVLYVEPVYEQAVGSSSYPLLRYVVAVYGNGRPAFRSTLRAALAGAVSTTGATPP